MATHYRARIAITPSLNSRPYSVANKTTTETPISTHVSENTLKKNEKIEGNTEKIEEKTETIEKMDVVKIEENAEEKKEKKQEKPVLEHGYEHGAHHWNMERGAAIGLIPLISTQMVYGAHPIVDGLVGVVLPYHLYLGFESCIIDYIPKRVYPRLHKAAKWTLGGTTGLVIWGCYEFNTNDIGITEFVQRLFAA